MCIFFCNFGTPLPCGRVPPKVLQGNAGHLGRVSSRRKIIAYAIPFLCRSTCPYASISRHSCTKKCTTVQFFFGKVCKCAFFFVPLWGNLEKCADTASINIFVPLRLCACTSAVGCACELFVRGLRCHAWRRYCHTARQGRAALQNNGTRCRIYPYEIRQFDDLCRGRI